MPKEQEQDIREINQPDLPEIEQPDIKEFEQVTEHPRREENQVQSAEMRYENADRIYE
jgi:hypothetical protein